MISWSFDAQLVPGRADKCLSSLECKWFTEENEMGDCILRGGEPIFTVEPRDLRATSDMAEQWTIFHQGAFRISRLKNYGLI